MDEQRIEDALRGGPPDEPRYRAGALERGLIARGSARPASAPMARGKGWAVALLAVAFAVAAFVVLTGLPQPDGNGQAGSEASAIHPASPSANWPTGTDVRLLVDRWVGAPRPIGGPLSQPTGVVLDIQGDRLRLDAGSGQPARLFESSIEMQPPNLLKVTSTVAKGGCQRFDAGTYGWSVSPGGSTLVLELIEDECAMRAVTLPGTWTHTACRAAGEDCLGPLEAGTYASTDFRPFTTRGVGQLVYSVPRGWANSLDRQTNYFLRPAAEYLADTADDGNDAVLGIYVWAGTLATDQPPDCSAAALTRVPRTADAIADHLLSLPGLLASDLGMIDIGERKGRALDLALDPGWTGACPFSGGQPFRSLIMFADEGEYGGVWGIGSGSRARVILVDVAPHRVVSIWIESSVERFDALSEEAMPIVRSMRFHDPITDP